jgi:hypothetical protein
MTFERAIRIAEKWANGGVCTLREGEAKEYHTLCLRLLREREERIYGTKFCESLSDGALD